MVSRRNYLAITAVMLVVFFLFQFTNVALECKDSSIVVENIHFADSLLTLSYRIMEH